MFNKKYAKVMETTIRDAWKKSKKTGENSDAWVTFKDIEEPEASQVWTIDEYDSSAKEYLLYNFADSSRYKYVKGDKVCFTGFTF